MFRGIFSIIRNRYFIVYIVFLVIGNIIGGIFLGSIKETKVYSINDFLNWHENGELQLSPKYQRKNVWNARAESYLIDTIIRGLPIPQVFLRQSIDTTVRRTFREVIDGQQRLRTIIKFQNNEFPLMRAHNGDHGGKYYDDLDEEFKMNFLDYQIPVELIKTNDDNVVYDLFMRVNTNSNILTKQELRNAKYWGDFKVLVYKLASKWRVFFINQKTFKDADFIRMLDAEYISSILILLREGIVQDTPIKIDGYYKKYDTMNDIEEVELLFELVMTYIEDAFAMMKVKMNFLNKKNYIYTLFAYVLFIHSKLKSDIQREKSSDVIINNLVKLLIELESDLNKEDELKSDIIIEFEQLHKSRTTNEQERIHRVQLLIDYLNEKSEFL